ncbi:MAG TPA: LON peptidase substrate-binding domain-containing protein [Tepidisphaeraceae bacterium]|nr:LON peptidase substrate-binding domain-containing protein [Tepidisphaeraceae bacterium]
MDDSASSANLSAVALFPLPNVVLFPQAVLPLHIFEHRYKQMTADVLAGDRQLAMVLLKPGWEKLYHTRPQIEPVVCVGTILSHEQLADGNYNFLLQGHTRAKIVREIDEPHRPYRVAQLEHLCHKSAVPIELGEQRRVLLEMFTSDIFASTVLAGQFRKLLQSGLSVAEVADLIAFNYFEDVLLKQSLLAECDELRRVERTIAELQSLRGTIHPPKRSLPRPSDN